MVRTLLLSLAALTFLTINTKAETIDTVLSSENSALGVTRSSVGLVDDMAFIRRASVDLIGRIPTLEELTEYQAWPAESRREMLVDKLVDHPRFADRWTVFFADLLRLRSNVTGGSALIAHVHRSLREDVPYNTLAASLISVNGKAAVVLRLDLFLVTMRILWQWRVLLLRYLWEFALVVHNVTITLLMFGLEKIFTASQPTLERLVGLKVISLVLSILPKVNNLQCFGRRKMRRKSQNVKLWFHRFRFR